MAPVVPGVLLNFTPELEREWQHEYHSVRFTSDRWWSVGLALWGASVARRWAGGEGTALLVAWVLFNTLLSTVVLVMQRRRDAYLHRRTPILIAMRLLRAAGVVIFIGPYRDKIYQPVAAAGGPLTALVNRLPQVAHIFCQNIVYQLPFRHHVWLSTASLAAVLAFLPAMCHSESALSATHGALSVELVDRGSFLYRLWVFSPSMHSAPAPAPWRACTSAGAFVLILACWAVPLMVSANVEEAWRHDWLMWRGGLPFRRSLSTQLLLTAATALPTAMLCHAACTLWMQWL